MKIGTKSVLFGAHCFFLHPWFVAWGWWKLYGFPFDPRLWVAFIVHDLGYIGKPNMDGPEGEKHPEFGAIVMSRLFDHRTGYLPSETHMLLNGKWIIGPWGKFNLYHSRYYAKANNAQPSRLCFADKLSFALTPAWMYLPMVTWTGEINEYLRNAQKADSAHWPPTGFDKRKWHAQLCEYMIAWVKAHKDGAQDTWTDSNRHAITKSGVLNLDGLCTNHIWSMEDGPDTHPVGIRMDCGDAGTVYLSYDQCMELANMLCSVLGQGKPFPQLVIDQTGSRQAVHPAETLRWKYDDSER